MSIPVGLLQSYDNMAKSYDYKMRTAEKMSSRQGLLWMTLADKCF